MNSRLDTLQAAILLPKLKAFAEHELDDVNRAAGWYTRRLAGKAAVPTVLPGFVSSWAQYTVLLPEGTDREAVREALKADGIPSMVYYPRGIHQQEAYRPMALPDAWYPNTLEVTRRCLSLPMHPYLKEEEADRIACTLLRTIGRAE